MPNFPDGNILVVCNDLDRALLLSDRIFEHSTANVVIVSREESRHINQSNRCYDGILKEKYDLPTRVLCVFLHSSDHSLLPRDLESTVFVFSSPGHPPTEEGQLPIYRQTSPKFGISDADMREMLEYAYGERTEVPICCQPTAGEETFYPLLRQRLHDIANRISKGINADDLRESIMSLKQTIDEAKGNNLARQLDNLAALISDNYSKNELLCGLATLQVAIDNDFGIGKISPDQDLAETIPDHPPDGFGTIVVADDDGYPLECQLFWKRLGYFIEIFDDFTDTMELLDDDPPAVLVCDMNWPGHSNAGCRLQEVARRGGCRFIVALSGGSISKSEAPDADETCSGAMAKTEIGVEQMHALIWRHAKQLTL